MNSCRKEKVVSGGVQNSEDLPVDNLLDFSNDDVSLNDENTLHPSNDFSTAGEDLGSAIPVINPGAEFLDDPVVKRQKKKPSSLEVWENGGQIQSQTQTQKCRSHFWVQKTPKWRRGPPQAKLMCNACGLQFNRLLHEYRPACNPAFSTELPAKVIEMRRKKEKAKAVTGDAQKGFNFSNLLDFSDDDAFFDNEDEAELNVQRKKIGVSVSLNDENTLQRSSHFSTAADDFGSLPVPMDDLAEIEWLSDCVDDSLTPLTKKPVGLTGKPARFSGKPAWFTMGKPGWLAGNRRHAVAPVNEKSCIETHPPVKIRSKRAETEVSFWSLGSPLSTNPSWSSTTSSGPSNPLLLAGDQCLEPVVKRQWKKKKKSSLIAAVCSNGGQTQSQARRCSNCGVEKTPQWRRGRLPEAKLLCNACGVRFNSGRLLTGYRPACSPTFSSELHSNHHSKVIEKRGKKKTSDNADEPGLKEPVQTV